MQGESIPAKRFARLSSALRASLGLVLDVAAAAVPDLSRAGRRRGFVSRLLVQALVHRAALLRPARHPIPLRWRTGPLVDGGDRRSAGVSPSPRRRALRRYRAQARPCLEI